MTWVSTPACGLSSPSGPWAITTSSAGISLGQLRPCFPGESKRSQQILISFLQLRVCGKGLLRCCSCGSADKTLKRLGKRQCKVCYQKRGCGTGAFWLWYLPDRWVKTATCTAQDIHTSWRLPGLCPSQHIPEKTNYSAKRNNGYSSTASPGTNGSCTVWFCAAHMDGLLRVNL